MARLIAVFVVLLSLGKPSLGSADGLEGYLSTLGGPSEIRVLEGAQSEATRISFESQQWRGSPWRHELLIKTPQHVHRRDLVVVVLTGGDGGAEQQDSAQRLADALGVRAVVLTRVPNQPLYGGKKEDDLLSFSLDQYRRSGDPSWPLLFPMVSSVVKGIDALEQVLGEQQLKVVLIGASKRGWTTYLTAAVEPRIVAMVPAVFEMVSMEQQIALMRERYGRDSEKIRPYTLLGLTDSLREPRVAQVISWLDPIRYFPAYTMPKLVLLGANDPYWVVDSVRRYWEVLPEPKTLRILPNVGHGVLGERAAEDAIVSFVKAVLNEQPQPQIVWRFSGRARDVALLSGEVKKGGSIARCTVWGATASVPDFRSARFTPTECQTRDNGQHFSGKLALDPREHSAVFGELELVAMDGRVTVVSTGTQVYPRLK